MINGLGLGLVFSPGLKLRRMVNGLGLGLGLWPEFRLRVMVWA